MRLKCLGCEALARLLYFCAARSPHVIDIELFQIGLHKEPADLRTRLQGRIDATVDQGYDAVVMAYGLCGQATADLTARDVPLVIPRAHDCITLFLGDQTRYSQEFLDHPGTYWYALDYCERSTGSISLGADSGEQAERTYDEYVQKYGQENADYLMEVMGAWQKHYDRAAFIDLGIGDSSAIEAKTQNDATRRGWTSERMAGDLVLIRRLLEGDWGEGFLRLEPGQQVTVSHDFDVVGCLPE